MTSSPAALAPFDSAAQTGNLPTLPVAVVTEVTATARKPRGRHTMVPTPLVDVNDAWTSAWTLFELDMEARDRSHSTVRNRRCNFTIMAKHAISDGLVEPEQVTRQWLQNYLNKQRKDRKGNGYTSVYQDIRAFWVFWLADNSEYDQTGQLIKTPANPMARIPAPKTVTTEVPVLSEDQINSILAQCSGRDFQDLRDRAIILMLVASGLRRFELAALDVDDVDIAARTVAVHHGKGDRPRLTIIGVDGAQALVKYLRVRAQRAHKTQPALFVSRTGKRLAPSGINQLVRRLGNLAGIEGLHPHMFRHAFADANLTAGMQEHDLMQLAGWTTSKQISRYGAARAQDRALEAGRRLARRLCELRGVWQRCRAPLCLPSGNGTASARLSSGIVLFGGRVRLRLGRRLLVTELLVERLLDAVTGSRADRALRRLECQVSQDHWQISLRLGKGASRRTALNLTIFIHKLTMSLATENLPSYTPTDF
jgi:integrase/recombinase XerC